MPKCWEGSHIELAELLKTSFYKDRQPLEYDVGFGDVPDGDKLKSHIEDMLHGSVSTELKLARKLARKHTTLE